MRQDRDRLSVGVPWFDTLGAPIESALYTDRLSARGAEGVLRLAWTLCDLRAADRPNHQDVTDALTLRQRTQSPRT